MLGLAEHYSKIPQPQRKQTMVFVALDGHHNSGEGSAVGNAWITQNRQKLFARTALAINVEHPATIQTQSRPRYYNANEIVWGNTYMPKQWYAGGPSRPELQKIVFEAFRQFGATLDLFPNPTPPASDMSPFFRFPASTPVNTTTTSIPTWRRRRPSPGPAWRRRPERTQRSLMR